MITEWSFWMNSCFESRNPTKHWFVFFSCTSLLQYLANISINTLVGLHLIPISNKNSIALVLRTKKSSSVSNIPRTRVAHQYSVIYRPTVLSFDLASAKTNQSHSKLKKSNSQRSAQRLISRISTVERLACFHISLYKLLCREKHPCHETHPFHTRSLAFLVQTKKINKSKAMID